MRTAAAAAPTICACRLRARRGHGTAQVLQRAEGGLHAAHGVLEEPPQRELVVALSGPGLDVHHALSTQLVTFIQEPWFLGGGAVLARRLARRLGGMPLGDVVAVTVLVGHCRPRRVPRSCRRSIATRSAAMPREPYAFTDPRDMPSVSATWTLGHVGEVRRASTSR
ncbi:hypothetical protein STANM309S_01892 [Streptomyces tanashiensis]